jgi:hypothetical protein
MELVLALVAAVQYWWGGVYVVVTDSGFTMAKTARALLAKGCHALGAIKVPFGGIPPQITLGKSAANKRSVGKMSGARSVDSVLGVQNWNDNGAVCILTTYHWLGNGANGRFVGKDIRTTDRRRRTSSMQWTKAPVAVPGAIADYSKYMSGVDKNDRLRSEYTTRRECKRWYMPLFYFALDATISQTVILFRMQSRDCKATGLLELHCELFENLLAAAHALGTGPERPLSTPDDVPVVTPRRKRGKLLDTPLVNHTPVLVWLPRVKGMRVQTYCDLCFRAPGAHRYEANVKCETCNKRFCYNQDRQCFDNHHFHAKSPKAEV